MLGMNCGAPARPLAVVLVVVAVVLGAVAAGSTASAASAPVTIKTVRPMAVAPGAKVVVRPGFSVRRGVRVTSSRVDVRRGSTWVARGVRSARVPAGTYRVTAKVTYRQRAKNGRLGPRHTVRRTQTLRVVQAAAAPAPVAPAPTVQSSLSRASTACDDWSMLKADGSPWRCTFSDEFTGTTLDTSKWTPITTLTSGYQLGDDCFVDDPDTIAVGNGVLSLSVRREAEVFSCLGAGPTGTADVQHTAGSVTTMHKFWQARGRFEIRAAFPATTSPGHQSALWLYPASPVGSFPSSGEIDIAEMFSTWPDRAVPNIHYGHWDSTVTNQYCTMQDVSAFHTYTLEWSPTTISIAFDGVPCVTHRITQLSVDPFVRDFILVLTQGLGVGDNRVTSSTPAVGTTRIDHVRVWK